MSNDYADQGYWDQRYSEETGLFDWYQRFDTVFPLLQDILKERSSFHQILHLGCGNSSLGEVKY